MQITKVKEQKNGYLVNDSIFVPNAQDNSDYQAVQKWIADGGVVEAFDYLAEAKLTKIAQLKANRNAALEKSHEASQAFEIIVDELGNDELGNKVFFEFSTKSTGIPLTEAKNILDIALKNINVKYSCEIIENGVRRKGYVLLNKELAENLEFHLTDRSNKDIKYANDLEAEINACTTIEEIEEIDINF